MNIRWRRRLQCAAACLLVIAYAGLSHYCNSTGTHALGAALALTPLTGLALVLAWRWTPIAAIVLAAVWAVLVYVLWPLLKQNFSWLYLLQESGIYTALGLTFSRSLRGSRIALCTHLADRLHGPLTPREVRYTRSVTAAWAVFFFAVAIVSVSVFLALPVRIWSIYINFCVPVLVGAMFVAEYLVRRRVLPHIKRAGLLATVRIYFASPQ